jgi:hypothetical protein
LGFMYLGAKVFEALVDKPRNAAVRLCSHWIDKYDNQFTSSPSNPSIGQGEDRLVGLLEVGQHQILAHSPLITVPSTSWYT